MLSAGKIVVLQKKARVRALGHSINGGNALSKTTMNLVEQTIYFVVRKTENLHYSSIGIAYK